MKLIPVDALALAVTLASRPRPSRLVIARRR